MGQRILGRLLIEAHCEVKVSIISYEEQMRGWLSEISVSRHPEQQRDNYAKLDRMLEYYCSSIIALFDDAAITVFQNLWLQRIRVGTMDLKIASIAIANDAVLLTRNTQDFSRIPGLKFEDWSV